MMVMRFGAIQRGTHVTTLFHLRFTLRRFQDHHYRGLGYSPYLHRRIQVRTTLCAVFVFFQASKLSVGQNVVNKIHAFFGEWSINFSK